jgi:deoxycytidylate deaminase
MKNLLPLAIEIANNLPQHPCRVAAIITDRKGRILSFGKNSYSKTSPIQAKYAKLTGQEEKIFLHAEIDAIVGLRYGMKPHTIYVARVNRSSDVLRAYPCIICQTALKDIGINDIIFTE